MAGRGQQPCLRQRAEYTVKEADSFADFHGDLTNARLVLYVARQLLLRNGAAVAAFEAKHPELKGRIYYETIPPVCSSER